MALTAAQLRAEYTIDESALDKSIGGLPGKVQGAAGKLAGAGLIIGGAVGGGLLAGMENERVNDKLAAQLGLLPAESERIGGVAGKLYADAYGENLSQVNDAVGAVMSSIGGMRNASSADLEAMTAKVLNLAAGFDIDVTRAAQVAGQMISTGLARDGAHAMDLLTASMQKVPAAVRGDLVDAIDEYGPFMRSLGLEGEEAMGLLVAASEKGMYGLDKTGDALKEFTIRATDMSTASKVGYDALGVSQEEMTRRFLAGGDTAANAFEEIIGGLRNIQDPAKQSQAALALFGTPLEDLNASEIPAFLDSLGGTSKALGDVGGAADRFGATLNDNASTALTEMKRTAELAVVGLANRLLPAVKDGAAWAKREFGPALRSVGDVLTGTVIPAVQSMAQWMARNETPVKVIAGLIGTVLVAAFGVWAARATAAAATNTVAWFTTATAAQTSAAAQSRSAMQVVVGWITMGAQAMLQGARMAAAWLIAMGPVGWVIAAVVGLVALIVANWDTVVAWTKAAWDAAAGAVAAAWEWIKGAVAAGINFLVGLFLNFTGVGLIIKHWDTIKGATGAAWDWIKGVVGAGVQAVTGAISTAWNWVRSTTVNAWNAVRNAVSNGINNAVSFVAGLPGRAANAMGSLGSRLWGVASGAFRSMWDAFANGTNNAVNLVQGLPGRVVNAIGNVGNLLYNIGRSIVQGFINGLKSAFGAVKDTLGGLTSMLPDWKGPPARDRTLLRGAGQHVIEGFIGGLEDRYLAVRSSLQGLTSQLAVAPRLGVRAPTMLGTGSARASAATSADGAGGGIGTLVNIEGDWIAGATASPQSTAQALVIEARTRGYGR